MRANSSHRACWQGWGAIALELCQPNGPDVMPPICVIMRRCNPRVPGLWLASWDVSALPVMSAAPPSALGRCAAAPRVAHRSRPTHQPRALRGHPASPPNLWPRLKGRRREAEQRRVRHQRPHRPISLCSRPSSGRFFQVDSFHPRQRVPSTGAVAVRSPIISGEMSAWTCFGSWRVPPRSPASSWLLLHRVSRRDVRKPRHGCKAGRGSARL